MFLHLYFANISVAFIHLFHHKFSHIFHFLKKKKNLTYFWRETFLLLFIHIYKRI